MPYSDPANKPWTKGVIAGMHPKTVLDVGAGAGAYLNILRDLYLHSVYVTAAEVWEPYVYRFQLLHRYDAVALGDIREREHFDYDLVILGDVLEHMTKDDAVRLWDRISRQARHAIISIPIIHYPQGEEEGNPFEAHVKDDWTSEEVLDTFSHIETWTEFDVTGVFVAHFPQD